MAKAKKSEVVHKTQVILRNAAAELLELAVSKHTAVGAGLIKLATETETAQLFFDDVGAVDEILKKYGLQKSTQSREIVSEQEPHPQSTQVQSVHGVQVTPQEPRKAKFIDGLGN